MAQRPTKPTARQARSEQQPEQQASEPDSRQWLGSKGQQVRARQQAVPRLRSVQPQPVAPPLGGRQQPLQPGWDFALDEAGTAPAPAERDSSGHWSQWAAIQAGLPAAAEWRARHRLAVRRGKGRSSAALPPHDVHRRWRDFRPASVHHGHARPRQPLASSSASSFP